MPILNNKRVLITGGTGSLGKTLVRRLLGGEIGTPERITIFSRDEGKQHAMRVAYMNAPTTSTEEVIYNNFKRLIEFRVGDVRNIDSIAAALMQSDIVINTAALKQVPTCEYFPYEAVSTNINAAENIVKAIRNFRIPIDTVVCISTDKAAKPVNVMGMTKAIQERIFLTANIDCPNTRFIAVRYGNVLASRGSVIPYFHEQIKSGGPITITHPEMTRFLLSLDEAVDIIFESLRNARRGETYIPIVPAANVVDIADALIGDKKIDKVVTGIRPGEKLHEILISEEEAHRAFKRDGHYVIPSILPEIHQSIHKELPVLDKEYSSEDNCVSKDEVRELLIRHSLMVPDNTEKEELLR
jgi:UDP-glucose 4-epimerase